MKPVEVKPDLYWVGAVDWDVRDFHGYSTKKGTTYNAFLLMDDKVVLFDTVKAEFYGELIHRIFNVTKPEKIDWLVINHLEPDHSGSLAKIVERVQPEKIFTSPNGKKAMEAHFHDAPNWPVEVVKTGDSISSGKHTISFLETRMVHWPDSMFSYIPEDKLLIASDGFGQHWATSERFDDEVEQSELMFHAAKYYANILTVFSPLIQNILKQVGELGLEIDCIAPDHGLIWRSDPGKIIKAYDRWSRQEKIEKVVVVFDTMWHATQSMAHAVADGVLDEGVQVKLMNLGANHRSDVMTEVLDARAIVAGSSTLNNNMLPRMADFLTYLKGLRPMNMIGTAFGSYGWSGEAVKQMSDMLSEAKIEVIDEGLKVNYVPDHDSLAQCRSLGSKVARMVKEAT